MKENLEQTIARLNGETGCISWQELERHYARGVLMTVTADQDLVMVAAHVVRDDKTAIEFCLESGHLYPTSEDNARDWLERDPDLWAVVVAPWVLVQERGS